jgi:Domain of unknown function (DUF5710)
MTEVLQEAVPRKRLSLDERRRRTADTIELKARAMRETGFFEWEVRNAVQQYNASYGRPLAPTEVDALIGARPSRNPTLVVLADETRAPVGEWIIRPVSKAEMLTSTERNPDSPTGGRIYLKVPYEERDRVKALGARLSPQAKLWWVPFDGTRREMFAEWLPAPDPGMIERRANLDDRATLGEAIARFDADRVALIADGQEPEDGPAWTPDLQPTVDATKALEPIAPTLLRQLLARLTWTHAHHLRCLALGLKRPRRMH